MKVFSGIPASEGIAIAKALVYVKTHIPEIPRRNIAKEEVAAEWERLRKARTRAIDELKSHCEQAGAQMGREQSDIFQAHILMLEDDEFFSEIEEKLKAELLNIDWVVWSLCTEMSQKLTESPDPVLRERSVDISDISQRLINNLLMVNSTPFSLTKLDDDVILAAHDLLPSDMLTMDKSRVKGIALDQGSTSSHTAILARAFKIPAVLGLSVFSARVHSGEAIAINGSAGTVILDPEQETLDLLEKEVQILHRRINEENSLRELPAETRDNHRVSLKANIGLPQEAEEALRCGAEGIGLFRTEFLFLAADQDSGEDAQYHAYCRALAIMGKLPVSIRTADMGGDKIDPGTTGGRGMPDAGENPLLGLRAIRFSFANSEWFKTQLRAILRASVHGTAQIMFPMISGIEELEQALCLLEEARKECMHRGVPIAGLVQTGIMIEVPSAAMTSDILARRSDFFSIGTNDLMQYSMAVDRENEKISYLADPFHPALLRLIKQTIDAAHKQGIKAAMCGELAGDPEATALLLGLGLDEFSMTASSIPHVKKIIRNTSLESCQKMAANVMKAQSIAQAHKVIRNGE